MMADGTTAYDVYVKKVEMATRLAAELPGSTVSDPARLKEAIQGIWAAVHETIPTRPQ